MSLNDAEVRKQVSIYFISYLFFNPEAKISLRYMLRHMLNYKATRKLQTPCTCVADRTYDGIYRAGSQGKSRGDRCQGKYKERSD